MIKYFILLLTLFSITFTASAEEVALDFKRSDIKSMSVVAPVWDGYTNADGSGLYWEVLQAIYEPVGITIKTANVPWNRAMKMVTRYSVYNAIVGEKKDTEEDLLFPKYAIDVEYMSVLTMANRKMPWEGVASLAGKKVGWMKDYDVISEKERNFELTEYRTVAHGLELLEAGRIDYMIDEWDEISEAVAANGQDMTRYVMNEMPNGSDNFVGFANTALSQILIEIYNERLPVIYQDKTLQAIYKKWGIDIPESTLDALE